MKEVKISELSFSYVVCVWEEDTSIGQHISSTQTMRQPEANTKRQATEHNWLPLLLADGDKESEEKKIFWFWPTKAARAEQISLYGHDKPNEPTMEGPPFICTL